MTPVCDNVRECHDMRTPLTDAKGGERAFCRICKRTYYLRHNKNGQPDKKQYAKLYYRWIVQPNKPLYYHVHPDAMKLGNIE